LLYCNYHNLPMRQHKRPLSLLIIGIISLLTLAALVYYFPPNNNLTFPDTLVTIPFSLAKFIQIPPTIIFFVLLAIFLFSIGSFSFKSKAHGILIAGMVVIYLLFRLNHLTHPFFLILLLALFFTLEMLVSSKNNHKL
jgi:hypothetical protein